MLTNASTLLDAATMARRISGAVLRVEAGGEVVHESAHGVTRCDAPAPVAAATWFDLASLTKILATTPAAMLLYQRGALALEAPLGRFLPGAKASFAAQPIENFLAHVSGAAAWKPLFRAVPPDALHSPAGKTAIVRALLAEAPLYPPGERQVYSDIGFALLGLALEESAGQPLHEFVAREIFAPLGIDELAYLQLAPRAGLSLAATEDCPWRGRVLAGETHDENTWAAGGCLGQSGVFGAARGVAQLADEFLAAARGAGRLFSPATLARFLRAPAHVSGSFRLGFDTPNLQGSAAGSHFGPHSFGHLGFTGCSVWCDPDRRLSVVLLTNRVHPTRDNDALKELRPAVHDAVLEECGLA
jgi:CubicO group peptidase (beta-lactamase class C family)